MTALAILTQEASNWRRLGAAYAWILPEFVARNGAEYAARPLPKPYKYRRIRQCFGNARKLVSRSNGRLRYVEGMLIRFHPIPHAWAIDAEDRVIDPTLRDPGGCLYAGVVFDAKTIARFASPLSWSLFDTGRGMNLPLFKAIDPALAPLIDDPTGWADFNQNKEPRT